MFSMYSVWMSAYVCVGINGIKGLWGTVNLKPLCIVYGCMQMGGGTVGYEGPLHMFPVVCVDMGGRETRGIRGYGGTDHKQFDSRA